MQKGLLGSSSALFAMDRLKMSNNVGNIFSANERTGGSVRSQGKCQNWLQSLRSLTVGSLDYFCRKVALLSSVPCFNFGPSREVLFAFKKEGGVRSYRGLNISFRSILVFFILQIIKLQKIDHFIFYDLDQYLCKHMASNLQFQDITE